MLVGQKPVNNANDSPIYVYAYNKTCKLVARDIQFFQKFFYIPISKLQVTNPLNIYVICYQRTVEVFLN